MRICYNMRSTVIDAAMKNLRKSPLTSLRRARGHETPIRV
jgi:hypothetical protein